MDIPIVSILREEFNKYSWRVFQKDLIAGINVAAVALPLSLAFGIASGADGPAGIITAILAGMLIGALSGIPNQVSGPTGAMSAVLLVVAKTHGLNGVWMTTLLAGVIIFFIGIFKLGRIILLIPKPVVTGFTSGIALIIFTGQLHNLLNVPPATGLTAFSKWAEFGQRLLAGQLTIDWHTMLTAGIVIVMMVAVPRRLSKVVPASLVGVALATIVVALFGFAEPMVGPMPNGLMLDQRLGLNAETLAVGGDVIVPAFSVAVLCCLQALLTGSAAASLTGKRMDTDHELVAQGIGNMIIPFFGGVPATGAIARTRVGIASGGQTRLTNIIHGATLFAAIMLAGGIIAQIPIAALSGVLIITAIRMNDWDEIRWMIRHRFKSSIAAFLVTMLATAALDLTNAILLGMLISMLLYIYRSSAIEVTRKEVDVKMLQERGHELDSSHPDIAVMYITGPMFFAAAQAFRKAFADHRGDRVLILSMRGVPLIDVSGLELIEDVLERQKLCGGELMLCAVQPAVRRMLDRSRLTEEIGAHNIFWAADAAILEANRRLGVS
jgi:SulP family sulfate permease